MFGSKEFLLSNEFTDFLPPSKNSLSSSKISDMNFGKNNKILYSYPSQSYNKSRVPKIIVDWRAVGRINGYFQFIRGNS